MEESAIVVEPLPVLNDDTEAKGPADIGGLAKDTSQEELTESDGPKWTVSHTSSQPPSGTLQQRLPAQSVKHEDALPP